MLRTKSHTTSLLEIALIILAVVGFSKAQVLAQDIEVLSADPPDAVQGTVNLDVEINGSGFKRGAKADFFLSGTTNPAGITVNSTRYIGPKKLSSNISVAEDAAVDGFDIQVRAGGRTGKGINLFRVTMRTSNAKTTYTWSTLVIVDGDPANLIGDCPAPTADPLELGYSGCLYEGAGTETESFIDPHFDDGCRLSLEITDSEHSIFGLQDLVCSGDGCGGIDAYLEGIHPRYPYESARLGFNSYGLNCEDYFIGQSQGLEIWSLGLRMADTPSCTSSIYLVDGAAPVDIVGLITRVDEDAWLIEIDDWVVDGDGVERDVKVKETERHLVLVPIGKGGKKFKEECKQTIVREGSLDPVVFKLLIMRKEVFTK